MAKQSEKETEVKAEKSDIIQFKPSQLTIVKDQKHRLYDERAELPVDVNLAANVGFYGILEPVLVTKEGDEILVVAGRQRVRAAARANQSIDKSKQLTVPCIFVENDKKVTGIGLSENEQRREDSPLVRMRKMSRMLEEVGGKKAVVAITFGVTTQTIDNALRVLSCEEKVLKAVENGEISTTVALQLHKLPKAEQITKVDELRRMEKATVAAASEIAGGGKGKGRGKKDESDKPARTMKTRDQIEHELDEVLKEWNGLTPAQQKADPQQLRARWEVLSWVLGVTIEDEADEVVVEEDGSKSSKSKKGKK